MNKVFICIVFLSLLLILISPRVEAVAPVFDVTPHTFSAVMNPRMSREFEFAVSGYDGLLNIDSIWIRNGSNRDEKTIVVTPSYIDLKASLTNLVVIRVKCYENVAMTQYNGKIMFSTEKRKLSKMVVGKLVVKSLNPIGASVPSAQTNIMTTAINFSNELFIGVLLFLVVGVIVFAIVKRKRKNSKIVLD